MRSRGLLVAIAALVVVVVLAPYWVSSRTPDPEDLARRCAASVPVWANYDEDLKASLGAQAFAAWEGAPVAAEMRGGDFIMTFSLSPPWSEFDFTLPLLVRDHLGHVIPGRAPAGDGAKRRYVFPLAAHGVAETPPWVTVRYPRHELRLTLGADGTWP